MPPRQGIPLRADPSGIREMSMRSLARAAVAVGMRGLDGGSIPSALSATDFLKQRGWDDDRVGTILTRAVSNPAMTTQAQWAAELGTVAQAFLESLLPLSAAAQLLATCLRLNFDSAAAIRLPSLTAGTAGWVAENAPIRVLRLSTAAGSTLVPHKLASIIELTREMMEGSNAEMIVRQALIDSTAPALDAALFSATAADATRPAGILLGATAVTASTSTDKFDAMGDDLGALVQAISGYAGNGSIALVMAPAQATRVALFAQRLPFAVLMSSAVTVGSVLALASNALAAVVAPVAIDAAKSVTVHEEDSSPQPVGAAAPERSLFQTDSVALRMKLPVTWTVRDSRAVASLTGAKW